MILVLDAEDEQNILVIEFMQRIERLRSDMGISNIRVLFDNHTSWRKSKNGYFWQQVSRTLGDQYSSAPLIACFDSDAVLNTLPAPESILPSPGRPVVLGYLSKTDHQWWDEIAIKVQ